MGCKLRQSDEKRNISRNETPRKIPTLYISCHIKKKPDSWRALLHPSAPSEITAHTKRSQRKARTPTPYRTLREHTEIIHSWRSCHIRTHSRPGPCPRHRSPRQESAAQPPPTREPPESTPSQHSQHSTKTTPRTTPYPPLRKTPPPRERNTPKYRDRIAGAAGKQQRNTARGMVRRNHSERRLRRRGSSPQHVGVESVLRRQHSEGNITTDEAPPGGENSAKGPSTGSGE